MNKQEIINALHLKPHPEGGWYRQVYHSNDTVISSMINQPRYYYTSIYFLIDGTSPSHFHRLKHDELWYYHAGSAINIHIIFPNGSYKKITLGNNLANGEHFQYMVPAGAIFGSEVSKSGHFSLVSCAVSPGFDYRDFEVFTQQQLIAKYPEHIEIINRLAYRTIP